MHDFKGNLDELRAYLFVTRKGDLRSLPPTEDAFRLHVLRSLYQIAVWKQASETDPQLPNPCKFGREVKAGILLAIPMAKSAKP